LTERHKSLYNPGTAAGECKDLKFTADENIDTEIIVAIILEVFKDHLDKFMGNFTVISRKKVRIKEIV